MGRSSEASPDHPEAAVTPGWLSPGGVGEVYEVGLWGAWKLLWSSGTLAKEQPAAPCSNPAGLAWVSVLGALKDEVRKRPQLKDHLFAAVFLSCR